MEIELRKAEVQHRFLQIKQARSFSFFWASLVYTSFINLCLALFLIELGMSKAFIFGAMCLVYILSLARMIIKERLFLENLKRKLLEKEEPETEVIDMNE